MLICLLYSVGVTLSYANLCALFCGRGPQCMLIAAVLCGRGPRAGGAVLAAEPWGAGRSGPLTRSRSWSTLVRVFVLGRRGDMRR